MTEPERTLNFDLSKNTVKLVAVSKNASQYTIDHCGRMSPAASDAAKQAQWIRDAIPAAYRSPRRISVSLWDSSMIVRKITLPLMTPGELRGAMRFEAEKHIPFSIDDCVLDYVTTARNETSKQIDVVLIACKKGLVDEKVELFRKVGQPLDVMDIHPFALQNAFDAFREPESKTMGLIHLGDTGSFIHVSKTGQPVLVRDIGAEAGGGDGKPSDRLLEEMVDNIKASVVFFENSFDESLDEIYIGSWGKQVEGFVEQLEETLEKKLKPWSIAMHVRFASDQIREEFTRRESDYLISMGLAVRG